MSDYELQFQAELERAQALSLESLALDQYRRQRSYSQDPATPAPLLEEDGPVTLRRRRDGVESEPPPALPPPPRRAPRVQRTALADQQPLAVPSAVRSNHTSPTRQNQDLISFTSPKPNDAHASLKEYIDQIHKLGQKTEEMSINPQNNSNTPTTNTPFHNQIPGYYYAQPYNQQYPFGGYPPAPYPAAAPYGMPSPMPMQHYPYYGPPRPMTPEQNAASRPNSSPYVAAIPYSQTRMSSPAAYMGYPPPRMPQPQPQPQNQYDFTTTNLILRATRPGPLPATSPSIYPQLAHVPSYLPRAPAPLAVTGAMTVPQPTPFPNYTTPMAASPVAVAVAPDESNSLRPDFSRKLSEASATSNESNDTVGSLPKSLNLIDFNGHNGASGPGSVRVSVLEAFDPLVIDKDNAEYMGTSECGSSVYEEFDPLDFLYGEAAGGRETVCVAGGRRDTIAALPSPPPKSLPTVPAVAMHTNTTNKLYDCIVQTRTRNFDVEHKGFLKMVLDVRKLFKYDDSKTNPGHVVAARSGGKYPPNTSIKILVHHPHSEEPITFTSDVESTVEHMIMHVVCSLGEEIRDDMSQFMLRVWGVNEYLTPGSSLSEYDYIRQCVRLEKDVRLCLMRGRDDSLARSERDDTRDAHLTLDELLPGQGAAPVLSFENLSILLETLEGELSRAVGVVGAEGACAPNAAVQAVKAICALVGCLETLHLTHTLNAFVQACGSQGSTNAVRPEIVSERGDYCAVSLRSATPREALAQQCARLRDALRALLQLYARSQPLHFQLADTHFLQPSDPDKAVPAHAVSESTLFCIEAVHRLPPGWKHDDYVFHAQIYHGTRPLRAPHVTQTYSVEYSGFYPRIVFDTWLNLEETAVCTLPRESRLVLTLYGRTARAADAPAPDNQDAREDGGDVTLEQEELGWAAIQLFSYDGMLISGNYILPIWSTCTDKRLGPAPHPTHAPSQQHASVNIEVPLYERSGVRWSAGSEQDAAQRLRREQLPAFESLDAHTQSQLIHLIEQGAYQRMPPDCREILWEKRQYLVQIPGALPLVLLAATNWYGAHRTQLMSLLDYWEMPSALNAIHLLLPCFPDSGVRELAARAISGMSDDAMTAVLPQLVQALRHETYHDSALARTLLRRALRSPPIAHRLYWLLVHSLPGATPQNSSEEFLGISLEEGARVAGGAEGAEGGGGAIVAWRWAHRYQLLLRALLATAGENLSHSLLQQKQLVKVLSEVAQSVKAAKEAVRQRALVSGMEQLCALLLRESKIALPLSLSQEVHGVDVKSCTYFNSNTLPLKINFIGTDNAIVPAMFKVGDDLRQDALVLQVMRVMDSLWLKEGLDLRMVSFQAIPTQDRKGMIEIVSEAETLRVIQTEFGLTGSFKDRPIAEWLAKHNPSELEYERARDNFTASCAGYSVATYLLGICDRHNDNIMLKTSGHLFHIDFGKFLGDAQMFGNFKRDRAPFVLTSDMAYVINGGERPSQRFHYFVELCCMAFNIVRAHHDHILDLFALMATSGVPGVTMGAVSYVRGALLPGATQAEAAAAFARLIHSSLKSKFTPINFFLHNLAQLRASGDQSSPSSELLSFMPRTYTMASEGRLLSVEVLGYEKRYDPEKHYVYSLRIYRQGQATPSVLYRSYKHFTELYQKICLHFPLAKVHSLPMGLHVGRSNTRQVAERRFSDVQAFLTSLFELADEIAHSDLVYTFFHPLLRDQQDAAPQRLKHKVSESQQVESSGSGSIKISVQYTASVLSVLILHAQSLALTPQGLPPNPYVKVYLVPDPTKETKRKTRVLKRNSHPSFMEMLEYRMPIDVVRSRTLQATVWHYDSLQENQFLGGVLVPLHSLPLRQETVGWYPLEYIPR